MTTRKIRPPLTYYGGKQTLAPWIISMIPEHVLYGEPFCGGAAVLFHKEPSRSEVINDTNGELINFYRVAKTQFARLNKLVQDTLHSRDAFRQAMVINQNPDMFDPVKRAWAIWTIAAMSFASKLDGPFGFDKTNNTTSKRIENKRIAFTEEIPQRLSRVQIECADALYVIQSRDHDQAFFYCDPPYVGSDCGHYKGYTDADYMALLQSLSRIKGKFLLSSYPSPMLDEFVRQFGWHQRKRAMLVTVNTKSRNQKEKTEVVTANYPLP
ncbi:DNA adenine methylase [Chitinophaga oryzae]|uniref:DNA adenine methylase n=1 Tax=Chitinophaga oryzae TaxID=2725414 RepID=A0AAE7DB22_9BACT|nr:DNA adenine methylase [Chitinophaga oryzae]QJB34924.1 DNA adenine methylase [Chitinophaga oryzae]QJB41435.1 DNA adenine methylase [Chitinophaga oryzae]